VKRIVFSIVPVQPFRLDLTAWALRRRPVNTIDCWDGETFRRALKIDGQIVRVAVRQDGQPDRARLQVNLIGGRLTERTRTLAKALLERMLGLRWDLAPFYKLAQRDPRLAPLAEEFRGLKPPRFPTVFEAVVNGIACQQLSLLVGILLLSRLTHKYGRAVGAPDDSLHAFPGPEDLARVRSQSLRALGFSGHKANFLLTLSSAIVDRTLDLEQLACLENEVAVDFLQGLSGVGRWTAEYVLLRGLGRLDIYPGDDVGARNNLARFLGRRKPLDYEGVRSAVAGWQPYAGFIYFHLLLARIKDAGWLKSNEAEKIVTRHNAASLGIAP
jgi:DNA-3-methyladenine glycosylase II